MKKRANKKKSNGKSFNIKISSYDFNRISVWDAIRSSPEYNMENRNQNQIERKKKMEDRQSATLNRENNFLYERSRRNWASHCIVSHPIISNNALCTICNLFVCFNDDDYDNDCISCPGGFSKYIVSFGWWLFCSQCDYAVLSHVHFIW